MALGAVTTVLATTVLTGCGDSSSADTSTQQAMSPRSSMSSMSSSPGDHMSAGTAAVPKTAITIKEFSFSGPRSVDPGATVTVTNDDSETHSVTADGTGGFDVDVPPGTSKTFTAPSTAGSYPFHCSFHSNMHGTLTVA
jgi:plastocyanin